jgi:hypothetical protein
LSSSHTEQTGRFIVHCAGGRLVFAEGVGGNKNEGSSYDAIVNQCNSFCHLFADAPVSTIPAVVDRMVSVPYKIDSLMPQNSFAGEVVVMELCNKFISSYKKVEDIANAYVKVIEPVNLELSVPPAECFNIRAEVLTTITHTPGKFSVHFIIFSERFERDTN